MIKVRSLPHLAGALFLLLALILLRLTDQSGNWIEFNPLSIRKIQNLLNVRLYSSFTLQIATCTSLFFIGTLLYRLTIRNEPHLLEPNSYTHLSRRETFALFITGLLLIFIYSVGYPSWRFALIGDEYEFFIFAKQLVGESIFSTRWFEASGVYADHPMALSMFQGLVMKIFGANNFGWRLSDSILSTLCLFPLYSILKNLFPNSPWSIRVLGCCGYFFSELIIVWSSIGKAHIAFMLPLIFSANAVLRASRTKSTKQWLVAGVIAGAGLFLSVLGAAAALVFACGIALLDTVEKLYEERKFSARAFAPPCALCAGFLLGGCVILAQFDFFQHLYEKNVSLGAMSSVQNTFGHRFGLALISGFYYTAQTHFMWGHVTDLISAALALVGLIGLQIVSNKRDRFLLWALISTALLSGGLAKYEYPPETRVHMMMFPFALLVSAGAARIRSLSRPLFQILFPVAVLMIPALNLWKLYYVDPYQRTVDFNHHIMLKLEKVPPNAKGVFLFSQTENPWLLSLISEVYGVQERLILLRSDKQGLEQLATLTQDPNEEIYLWVQSDVVQSHTTLPSMSENTHMVGSFNTWEKPEHSDD